MGDSQRERMRKEKRRGRNESDPPGRFRTVPYSFFLVTRFFSRLTEKRSRRSPLIYSLFYVCLLLGRMGC